MTQIPFIEKLRRREVIGMDIGGNDVKLARFQRNKDRSVSSVSLWHYPHPLSDSDESCVAPFRDFLHAHRLLHTSVACNIEDPSLRIRRVDLPKMPASDMPEAVRWQMRDVVEGSIPENTICYSELEEYLHGDVKRLSVVAYAVKKNVVLKRMVFLKKLGLNPVALEPTSVSLLAAFHILQEWREGEYYGLIHLSGNRPFFVVVSNHKLFFSRPLADVSGGASTTLSIEAQRSVDAFSLLFRKEKIHHLYLCGDWTDLSGLEESLTKNLAIPTSLLDPSGRFSIREETPYLYNVALGLALYE